tara:strand:- start:1361 stop:2797 length:1437 start_codon:yes stop_codon:yes gene_type:complete
VTATSPIALSLLMDRLSWPVKMVRWKAAKAIRMLVENEETNAECIDSLLSWIASRVFESEVISGLSILLILKPSSRPSFERVCASIARPSLLSELLLERIYEGRRCGGWEKGHSGNAPKYFVPARYFEEFKKVHVPPIFTHNVDNLERQNGLPFAVQWAYEWQLLTEATQTAKTNYAHHFGDFGLQQAGIGGQFCQRQGEVYRSAYLRMLSYAANVWGMPPRYAANYLFNALSLLPGLFDVEPQQRPSWLGDLPSAILRDDGNLVDVGKAIVAAGRQCENCLVALGTPFPVGEMEFGDLELLSFFVSEDFEPEFEQKLQAPLDIYFPGDLTFGGVRKPLEMKVVPGKLGTAISVCADTQPVLRGFWHDDYFQRGLLLPASYCFDVETTLHAGTDGLNVTCESGQVAQATFWHDAWTPLYAKGSPTRCGIATFMRRDALKQAASRFGMRIGWSIRANTMVKDDGFSELNPSSHKAFFLE